MESESSRAEVPVISPVLVGPPPRKTQLTGKGIALAVVTAVVVAIAAIYAFLISAEAFRQFQIRAALRGHGNETIGQINELRNPFHALKEHVDYTFVADGNTHTGEAIVPLELYHILKSASSLPIRYLPQNPAVNHPADWEWSAMSELDPCFLLFLVAGLGCLLFIPPQLRFQRRLAVEGVATMGVVTKCSVSGRYGEFISLRYEFRTEDGVLAHGRGSFQTQLEVGARILILYRPQKPSQNSPYPLSNWRIAAR